MSTSPHMSKIQPSKGRLSKVTLESLYDHFDSVEKMREVREIKDRNGNRTSQYSMCHIKL